MEIILYQPEIPQNTGNVVRTCAVTNASLTLVRPLGFSTSDKALKRAGLDYWHDVDINYVDDLHKHLLTIEQPFYFFSSKASLPYTEICFGESDLLIFGSEQQGLPEFAWDLWPERFYRIPMRENARCLNLSNSVAIVLYEALRQQKFQPLAF